MVCNNEPEENLTYFIAKLIASHFVWQLGVLTANCDKELWLEFLMAILFVRKIVSF